MKFKNMTIGVRIAGGFGVVLAMLTLVGILSYTGVGGIVGNAGEVIEGNKLAHTLAEKEVDHLNWANKVNALLTDEKVSALDVQTDCHKCAFGKWLYGEGRKQAEALVPSLAPLLKEIEAPHRKLHESAIAIGKVFKQADAHLPALFTEREVDHLKWAAKISDTLLEGKDTLNVQADPTKCALGKWLNGKAAQTAYEKGDAKFKNTWNAMLAKHQALHESAHRIQDAMKVSNDAAREVFAKKTIPLLGETVTLLNELKKKAEHDLQGMEEANHIFAAQTAPALRAVQNQLHRISDETRKNIMTDEAMLSAARGTQRNVTIMGVAAVLVGIVLAFFISRGIIAVLRRVSGQMGEGAEQVASASGQVSASSQSLAEGASEQAASIEETSSSLEEMSSMTNQNADHSGQANQLMAEVNRGVEKANESMSHLTRSMEEISRASEETSKIIKTIDEIAFQTNLLALNAAVEAARAGEAGAGFAVVADEVRNLAMRAADAAKNTSGLIEGTVKKVKDGAVLVTDTNEAFVKVAESASKVGELVGEIAAASREQAQGIEQINTAVSEMDKVVQQNAANAEESASASEEMNAQAEEMNGIVDELLLLVGGRNGASGKGKSMVVRNKQVPRHHQGLPVPVRQAGTGKASRFHHAGEVDPQHLIPFDDDEFREF